MHFQLGTTLPLLACLAMSVAQAKDPIRVNSSVAYFSDGVGSAEIRRQCDWNTKLIEYLIDETDDVVVSDESSPTARMLKLAITTVQAGSRTYERDNWAEVRGELVMGEQVIANFRARAQTHVLDDASACEVLDQFAIQLAAEIADWTDKPKLNAWLGDWR
jgi:hypothetical protein